MSGYFLMPPDALAAVLVAVSALPRHPKQYGAVGNGTTDDSAAIMTTDALGAFVFQPGVYLWDATNHIDSPVTFAPGAIVKVADGAMLKFNGPIMAGEHQIFELDGTGTVDLRDSGTSELSAMWFGAKADGSDDTDALRAVVEAAPTGAKIVFPARRTFHAARLHLTRSVHLDGRGSMLVGNTSAWPDNNSIWAESILGSALTFTQTLSNGNNTLNVSNSFSAGDWVFVELGVDPFDSNEPHIGRLCEVRAATSTTVTLDFQMPFNINGTSHKVSPVTSLATNITIENFCFDWESGIIQATSIWIGRTINTIVRNIKNMRSRICMQIEESINHVSENIDAGECIRGVDGHLAAGRVWGAWQAENCMARNLRGWSRDANQMVFFENWNRQVTIEQLALYRESSSPNGIIQMASSKGVSLNGVTLYTTGASVNYIDLGGTSPVDYIIRDLVLPRYPVTGINLANVTNFVDEQSNVRLWSIPTVSRHITATLNTNSVNVIQIGRGVLKSLWIKVDDGAEDVNFIFLRNGAGFTSGTTATLVNGQFVRIPEAGQYGTGFAHNNPAQPQKGVQIHTNSNFPNGAGVELVAEYWPLAG